MLPTPWLSPRTEDRQGLAASPLFQSLPLDVLRTLEPELSCVKIKSGATLFNAGEPGDSLYVVVFGRLRAIVKGGAGDQVLGEIGRGESVGEMALLTGEPRSAAIRAVRDTELLQLSKGAFERVVAQHPQVMMEFARLIIARYQRALRSPAPARPAAITIVPCADDRNATALAGGLFGVLRDRHKTLALDRAWLERERGLSPDRLAAASEGGELSGWLEEQERTHDYLLYVADSEPSAWTRLCVRQADVILLVGGASELAGMESGLLELLQSGGAAIARRELVLLYDSARSAPERTREWLATLPVDAHHHVDLRRSADLARLGRLLTGTAIGLVLGGGGARGLAHIGVIRALEEARIPIDLVGGTSIGAVIGAQCASGWDSRRIRAESRRVLVERGSLNDYTLPLFALLHGRRYIRMLDTLFAQRRIEDLPIAYFCVSTNLTRSEVVTHRAGSLRKWVAASMAVPGLGPPIFDGRDILVDGGVLNGLPIDIMRGLRRGPVLASSVSPKLELRLDREYPDIPSPWRVLLSKLNPFGTPMRLPGIGSILMRSASLKVAPADGDTADLLFEPPVAGYKLLDWHALDKLEEIGYRAGVSAIESWEGSRPAASPD